MRDKQPAPPGWREIESGIYVREDDRTEQDATRWNQPNMALYEEMVRSLRRPNTV